VASVQEHYKNMLAPCYSWIYGGSDANLKKNRTFFYEHKVRPTRSGVAVDLGAGCGFQSIPLAESGFNVIAIDQSHTLLAQLKKCAAGLPIVTIQDDLLNFTAYSPAKVETIVCMGDTLTHLDTLAEVQKLIESVYLSLEQEGFLILSFRDMSVELSGLDRFIPLRSDSKRIFTCFLEYEEKHVKVHDILYEKTSDRWTMKKSFFRKLRISRPWTLDFLQQAGFIIEFDGTENNMITIRARKH
jgi:16S rRNA G527 N7-methylase RsmG